jgi:hypothetical protein
MTVVRLHALLDAYGADPARWPAAEREAALGLLARSPEARAYRDAAARLDAALDAAPPADAPSADVVARVLRAAPRRRWIRIERIVAVAAPLAAAAGLVLWLVRAPAPAPPALSERQIAALDVYDTPTDALLASIEGDVVDDPPALGCSPGALGCLDVDPQEPDDTSRRETTGGMRA